MKTNRFQVTVLTLIIFAMSASVPCLAQRDGTVFFNSVSDISSPVFSLAETPDGFFWAGTN